MALITRRQATAAALASYVASTTRSSAAEKFTAPPLWVVERGSSKVYLFGQSGLRAGDVWLTDGVRQAFDSSTELWVENPDFPPPSPSGSPPPASSGPKLFDVASAQDIQRIRAALARSGMAADTFDALPLDAGYPALSSLADRALGVDYTVLPERVLKERAKASGKPVHSEWASLDEIRGFLSGLPEDERRTVRLQLVRRALDEIENVKAVEQRIRDWLAGSMESLDALDGQLARTYPQMHHRIGTERNKDWVPRIEAVLARTHTAFLCVGILHLAGTQSIQAQLRRRGLVARRV